MQFLGTPPAHDLTYSDVFLVPSRSEVGSRLDVDLAPNDGTGLTIPLIAANMNSVAGPRMAASMARRGGMAVLPQDLDTATVHEQLHWVKSQPPLVAAPFEFDSDATVAHVHEHVLSSPNQGVAVRQNGETVAIIPADRLTKMPVDAKIGDLLHLAATRLSVPHSARAAFDALADVEGRFAAIEQDGEIVGYLSQTDALRGTLYEPAVDGSGNLRVAAAVGINGDVVGRATGLVEAGADVLVLDTAHGHQEAMLRAIERVRAAELNVPIVAGNVVSAAGTRDLINAGANIVKVGVGPGAMCTTRMMTAVGRPQFSAVLECAEVAAHHHAAVWADGGVRYPRDVALALAAGATSVMVGSWFAGTLESPGVIRTDEDGALYKESFGMASTRAVAQRFGHLDEYERARKLLFAEGISNSRMLIDPDRPSVEDLIDLITTGVRSSFTYAGAGSVAEFQDRAKVGVQSAAGYEEGKPLAVSW